MQNTARVSGLFMPPPKFFFLCIVFLIWAAKKGNKVLASEAYVV